MSEVSKTLKAVNNHLALSFHSDGYDVKERAELVDRIETLYMEDKIEWSVACDVLQALGQDVQY